MKIAFNLTDERNIRDGVTHYAVEIINRAPKDIDCTGEVFLCYRDRKARLREYFHTLMPKLKLKMKRIFLPLRTIIWMLYHCRLPFSYDFLIGNRADARVFVLNFLPRCRIKGKTVIVIHDMTPLRDSGVTKKQIKKLMDQYRRTVERADLIFTDSEFSKGDILSHFPEASEKLKVVYAGIDTERFSAPVPEGKIAAVREKYGLPHTWLLFMGQARQNKNLENLMRGFALLPAELRKKYPLVLANHAPTHEVLAKELGIEGEVVLLNGIEEEDVTAFYHGARALTLVSTSEGFGLPLVEAMAAEIPSVASNATCLPEVAGDAARFVDPYDPQSISEGLSDVLTDEQLRAELIQNAHKQVARYSWDATAKVFYEEIAGLIRKD